MHMHERSTLDQGGRTCKQRVSGIREHKSMQKAAYSMFTAYLQLRIKTRHLRSEDRVETASITLSWLFHGLFSCPT